MYLTEKEIYMEFDSINRCVELMQICETDIKQYFNDKKCCWIIGSGSSYLIAKSAAKLLHLRNGMPAFSVTAGDLMLHFEKYKAAFQESVVVFLSRSGNTSEVLFAVDLIKEYTDAQCISICAKDSCELIDRCEFSIRIPWAFDESVCQTRTVGSLYSCAAMMVAIVSGDAGLKSSLRKLADAEPAYRDQMVSLMKQMAVANWDHIVVLADAEVSGLMEEGALAFKEICQVPSNYYNVLDVRHGPIVMINEKTLVAIYVETLDDHVKKLVRDICAQGSYCIVMGTSAEKVAKSNHLQIPATGDVAAECLFALYALQVLAYQKALVLGVNPDFPDGLSPWIVL